MKRKVNFLLYSTYHYSFLEDTIYTGLRENIGSNHTFSLKPIDKNYQRLATAANKNSLTDEEILERLDEFDFILFFSNAFFDKNFINLLNTKTYATKIFIDQIDDFFVRRIYFHPEIKHYFKRELYKENPNKKLEWQIRYLYANIRAPIDIDKYGNWFSTWNMPIDIADIKKFKELKPFQLTTKPLKNLSKKKRVYDISFIGHANNPERNYYLDRMKQISSKSDSIISTNIVSQKEYFRITEHSKACLALRGTGYDTWRYWEAPAHGAALLAQKTPILIPHNFVDLESALYFKDKEELEKKFNRYILDSDEWKEIARNGYKHFLKYHTPQRRVKELLLDVIM